MLLPEPLLLLQVLLWVLQAQGCCWLAVPAGCLPGLQPIHQQQQLRRQQQGLWLHLAQTHLLMMALRLLHQHRCLPSPATKQQITRPQHRVCFVADTHSRIDYVCQTLNSVCSMFQQYDRRLPAS